MTCPSPTRRGQVGRSLHRGAKPSAAWCYSAPVRADSATSVTIRPARRVVGHVRVPGDKSISHRYALLAAIADGETVIEGFAPGADCAATLACLSRLGVRIASHGSGVTDGQASRAIAGRGIRGLTPPDAPLDTANSGTTLRLLAGLLAGHPFDSTLTGDASLRRRPMKRIIEPLVRMGAHIQPAAGDRPPLMIHGSDLHGIEYRPPVASAQVKSAVLLAGLHAQGATILHEPATTRDHTERALVHFGATVERHGDGLSLAGGQQLRGGRLHVPGDFSSAAFWAVAAAALPGSDLELTDVGLNPTRTALVDVLRRLGAGVETTVEREEAGEPVGRMRVRHGMLRPLTIKASEVPVLIDELPALAALGAHGGDVVVTGASELRVKESDRISALVAGMRALGIDAEELPDGFHIRETRRPRGGTADAVGDHRLAMTFAIAALGASASCTIQGAEAVDVSYPGFFNVLASITE